ncbi:EspF repeat-containing protein [Streptomyces sp. NPDC091278]|uniref:EspF repeat-containing protein n=1 Tax=Streptomyces sp. NPDC091278 TaxID=3155301 RepID=UPI00344EFA86
MVSPRQGRVTRCRKIHEEGPPAPAWKAPHPPVAGSSYCSAPSGGTPERSCRKSRGRGYPGPRVHTA